AGEFPSDWLTERMTRLAESERGIHEGPFLLPQDVQLTVLGGGSVVASEGASHVETLFAIAAAVQELRNATELRRLYPRFPLFQVVDANNFVNFSEALIRACLLRSLTIDELGESLQQDVGRQLNRCVHEQGQSELVLEVLVAAARGLVNRETAIR